MSIGRKVLLALSLVIGATMSCSGSSLRPAGTSCSTDGDCAAGLVCLGLGMFTEAGCTSTAKACTKSCLMDSDCVSVGPKFKCFADCSGSNTCGQTQ